MSNRQKRFRMEKLEARQMMAGDIAANVDMATGDLTITEAPGQAGQSNTVVVSTLANGWVSVSSPSLINGQNLAQDFAVSGKVKMNLAGGGDHVTVNGANFSRLMEIKTGAGQDIVDVRNSTLRDLMIQTYDTLLETDADQVDITDVGAQSVRVFLGGGNDRFGFNRVTASNDIEVNAGAGNDTGWIGSCVAKDEVMARMGEDTDNLTLYNVFATRLTAHGESGTDSLTTRGQNAPITQTGWEWVNGLRNLDIRLVNDLTPVRRTLVGTSVPGSSF